MLTEALEKQFRECEAKFVKYTYFDFHTETKGDVRNFKINKIFRIFTG